MKRVLNRKFLIALACFCATLFIISCQQEAEPYEIQPLNSTFEADKELIESLGFDTSNMEDWEDSYLVEGDIRISKKTLSNVRQNLYTRQKRVDPVLEKTYVNTNSIYVYADSSVPTSGTENWRPALQAACQAWTNISNCAIRLVYTTNPSIADITLSLTTENTSGYIAWAWYPFSPIKPGPSIVADSKYSYYTDSQKTWVLVHELGHTLGFAHPNQDFIQIPGTPTEDHSSVMYSHGGGRNWLGFTSGDILAAQILYPIMPTNPISVQIGTIDYYRDRPEMWYMTFDVSSGLPVTSNIHVYAKATISTIDSNIEENFYIYLSPGQSRNTYTFDYPGDIIGGMVQISSLNIAYDNNYLYQIQ